MISLKKLFYTKPLDQSSRGQSLQRCLTATDLTMLGVGGIIGAGIFVLTGIAASTQAGPAIIFSYLLAGLACAFCAFSYAELASSVGGCGSAYGYAYASLGEFIAWIIGWDLLLSYGMNGATVSIGWSGYIQEILHAVGITLPNCLVNDPFHGGILNLPAVFVIFLLASILSISVKESARFNKIIVYIKLSVIALFIGVGIFHFNPDNWKPFLPFGVHGIVNGASLILFAYIGFDAISTAAEEAINPQRDLPRAIIASLVICSVIYIIASGVLTGIMYYPTLNISSPVATALFNLGHKFLAEIVAVGAIAGLTSVILVMFFGVSRVFLAMARDGLLPKAFIKVHKRTQTPRRLIWLIGGIMAIAAGVLPIHEVADLVNIGTLAAFVVVCIGVIVLRRTKPEMKRPFKTPFYPYSPILGILLCVYLMAHLPTSTWWSFSVWTLIGLFIYFIYGRVNSIQGKQIAAT